MELCEYATDMSNGIQSYLRCELSNSMCGMCRFCIQKNRLIMSDTYHRLGCNIKRKGKDVMATKKQVKKIEDKPIVAPTSQEEKVTTCSVNFTKDDKSSICYQDEEYTSNFYVDGTYTDFVEIHYIGEFNSSNITKIIQK